MLGTTAGDIIGPVYKFHPIKTRQFPLFSSSSEASQASIHRHPGCVPGEVLPGPAPPGLQSAFQNT